MEAKQTIIPHNGILTFNPSDKLTLYKSYMPFLKNGGIYVTTPKPYQMGAQVFVLATLPETKERMPIVGEVVWIHTSTSVTRPAGIGLRFLDTKENAEFREKIEQIIVGISADTPTFTM